MTEAARNHPLEQHLAQLAAHAAGHTQPGPDGKPVGDDGGLRKLADYRAHPGGIRTHNRNFHQETAEELADASNYLLWGAMHIHAGYEAGDPEAAETFARYMRCLQHVVAAWHALHTH